MGLGGLISTSAGQGQLACDSLRRRRPPRSEQLRRQQDLTPACPPSQGRLPSVLRSASAEVPPSPHPLQLPGSRGSSDTGLASLAPPSPPLPPPLAPSHVVADRLAAIAPALAALTTESANAMAAALQPPRR